MATFVADRLGVDQRSGCTVADAMLTDVKISRPDVTVGELRMLFADEHVHAAVLVDDGVLLGVVDRADLTPGLPDNAPAAGLGRRGSRMVSVEADLGRTWQRMVLAGRRRVAVVGPDGRLRGLLCLKRTRRGFCSDHDVRCRSDTSRSL